MRDFRSNIQGPCPRDPAPGKNRQKINVLKTKRNGLFGLKLEKYLDFFQNRSVYPEILQKRGTIKLTNEDK